MYLIILGILILGLILLIIQRSDVPDKLSLLYLGGVLYLGGFLLVPFYDAFQLGGYIASVLVKNSIPSIFGILSGIVAVNCAVYGAHVFFASMRYKRAERFKSKMIFVGQYAKRRHPIFASFHVMGLSYCLLMGTLSGFLIFNITIILLYLEARNSDARMIQKFGDAYLEYKQKVSRRMYSVDINSVLIVLYSIFFIGVVGVTLFSEV